MLALRRSSFKDQLSSGMAERESALTETRILSVPNELFARIQRCALWSCCIGCRESRVGFLHYRCRSFATPLFLFWRILALSLVDPDKMIGGIDGVCSSE
eukprot:196808-Amphidinium_carterae.1